MKEIEINSNEAGQRFDKFLGKYLDQAPKSFLYKMLRKKNITLNGKKAAGNEILALGDNVKLFFSDETIKKFSKTSEEVFRPVQKNTAKSKVKLNVLYEDENVIFLNKPSRNAFPESKSGRYFSCRIFNRVSFGFRAGNKRGTKDFSSRGM